MKFPHALFLLATSAAIAADEPLIPAALNNVLPKIHAGMTIGEVEAVLAPAYPGVKGEMGNWSGQTGYIEYKLKEQLVLSVSSITREGKEVVHTDLLFYLVNHAKKHRVDIKSYFWERPEQKKTEFLK